MRVAQLLVTAVVNLKVLETRIVLQASIPAEKDRQKVTNPLQCVLM